MGTTVEPAGRELYQESEKDVTDGNTYPLKLVWA